MSWAIKNYQDGAAILERPPPRTSSYLRSCPSPRAHPLAWSLRCAAPSSSRRVAFLGCRSLTPASSPVASPSLSQLALCHTKEAPQQCQFHSEPGLERTTSEEASGGAPCRNGSSHTNSADDPAKSGWRSVADCQSAQEPREERLNMLMQLTSTLAAHSVLRPLCSLGMLAADYRVGWM